MRLVALDVDGTVVVPDGSIAPSTIQAVAEARAAGVHVVLASARGPVALERVQDALDLRHEWFIGYQAALVARVVGEALEVLSESRVDLAAARHVEERAMAAGLSVGRYCWARWRVRALTPAVRYEASMTGEQPLLSTAEESDADAPPHKLMVDREHQRCLLAGLAGALPGTVTGTLSHPGYLEVAAAGVDKASGLLPLAALLKLSVEATAAVGDGLNDRGLFAVVGHAVAMGQAPVQVPAAASRVTSVVTADGVARALHHLGVAGGRP